MAGKATEIKVVLLGHSKVGKSSIALRFTKNEFLAYAIAAPGTSTMSKRMSLLSSSTNSTKNVVNLIGNKPTTTNAPPCHDVDIKIWDTAGHRALVPIYYKRADAAILVYDVCNFESFVTLQTWANELRSKGPPGIKITICGNKSDNGSNRVVDMTVARIYAEEFGGYYIETSAKNDISIQQLFIDTVRSTKVFCSIRPVETRKISKFNSRPISKSKPTIAKNKPSTTSKYNSLSSTSTAPKKKRKFDHEVDATITTKRCSFCLTSNAAVIVGGIAEKPLCLLHYHTTRAIRIDNKVKEVGNGSEMIRQLPEIQDIFAEAFVDLQKEIEEENARSFKTQGGGGAKNTDLLGAMLGNAFGRSKKKR